MKTKYNWNKDEIETAVKTSISYIEVLRKLKVNERGRNAETLKKKIKEYGISTTHFTGRARVYRNGKERSIQDYFTRNSTLQSSKVRIRLVKEGIVDYKCAICGLSMWRGKPIVLQLHHIDGDHHNNSLENLQLLCPNCHSQTDNYCGCANK